MIALWNTYPPHENYGVLPNVHKQAVLDIAFSLDSETLYSVRIPLRYNDQANQQGGADGALVLTSPRTGERLGKYAAHYGPLNSIAVAISGGRELVLTGGDDGTARVFDPTRVGKDPVAVFDDGRDCPVTAVEWSKDGNQCYVGGVDNEVKVWDLRKNEVVFTLRGHTDTVSPTFASSSIHCCTNDRLHPSLFLHPDTTSQRTRSTAH